MGMGYLEEKEFLKDTTTGLSSLLKESAVLQEVPVAGCFHPGGPTPCTRQEHLLPAEAAHPPRHVHHHSMSTTREGPQHFPQVTCMRRRLQARFRRAAPGQADLGLPSRQGLGRGRLGDKRGPGAAAPSPGGRRRQR